MFFKIINTSFNILFFSKVPRIAPEIVISPSAAEEGNLARAIPFEEMNLDPDSTDCIKYGEKLKKFYFGLLPISEETMHIYVYVNYYLLIFCSNQSINIIILQLLGDKNFNHSYHRTVLQRHHSKSAPTYLYRFDFDSYLNFMKRFVPGKNDEGLIFQHCN